MKILITIFLCIAISPVSAQTFDEIVASNKYVDCQDVSFNAVPIIETLYSINEIDSIYQFLDYWESKCGFMESAFRLRNILDIKSDNFIADSISTSLIELLISYRLGGRSIYFYHHNDMYNYQNDFTLRKDHFDSLTQHIAQTTSSDNWDESLLLDFYSSESPTFEKIKNASDSSRLNQLYRKLYTETLRKPQYHIAFITGAIQTYGDISIFGTRPNFGLAMGWKKLRHNYDFILDIRAGPSREEYSFIYQDSLISANTWTGIYVGFEYTLDLIHSNKIDIGISPGIGYDAITALSAENDYGEDAKNLSSFNKNLGLVFKYKFGENGGYVGCHFRYNWSNYHNPGGTDLDGEYLNIRLTIGGINDYWRDSKLQNLQ